MRRRRTASRGERLRGKTRSHSNQPLIRRVGCSRLSLPPPRSADDGWPGRWTRDLWVIWRGRAQPRRGQAGSARAISTAVSMARLDSQSTLAAVLEQQLRGPRSPGDEPAAKQHMAGRCLALQRNRLQRLPSAPDAHWPCQVVSCAPLPSSLSSTNDSPGGGYAGKELFPVAPWPWHVSRVPSFPSGRSARLQ